MARPLTRQPKRAHGRRRLRRPLTRHKRVQLLPAIRCATQTESWQNEPVPHCASAVHAFTQAVAAHTYGWQAIETGSGQAPVALQVAASVSTPAVQLAPRQAVAAAG